MVRLRGDFLIRHPEISVYFERRREEKAQETLELAAFDESDPRLRPFYAAASDLERAAAAMRYRLAIHSLRAMGIETRRDRRAA